MPDSPGYETAERLIKEYYGNAIKITAAYMERALARPPIRSEDASSLQAFMLFLKGYCNMMRSLQYMNEMNVASNLKATGEV